MSIDRETYYTPTPREQAILEAFIRCLDREDPEKISMDEVAEEAHMAKATLYRHFPTKEALIDAAKEYALTPLKRDAKELLQSPISPDKKLMYLAQRILRFFHEKHLFFKVILLLRKDALTPPNKWEESDYHQFIKNITQVMEEGIQKGIFCNLHPERLATYYVEAIYAMVIYQIFQKDTSLPPEATAELFIRILFYGILEEKTR